MRRKLIAVVALVATVVAPTLLAADLPSVATVACASPLSPVKITSSVPAGAVSAKVYYRATGAEYYSDMRKASDGTMWAFIPAPEVTTKSISYRVVSTDANGAQVSSPVITVNTSASCPAQALTSAEQNAANNMIVGLTNTSQSPVPTGFLCRGIVSYISANGELRPNEECRRIAALGAPGGTNAAAAGGATGAAATTGGGGAAAAGLSHGTIVALTAVGLTAAGVAIYQHNHHKHHKPVSPSRP